MGLITALAVVLSTSPAAAAPVLLQSTSSSGPDPYTTSPTKAPPPAAATTSPSSSTSTTSGTKVVSGATEGLYGGTQNVSSCDVNQLSDFLTTHPDKGKAWAGVEGIAQSDIPAYLHSLTPVVLRVDTRVTNHGFANGQATTFQSVLQAGTAVLVDNHGVPRSRCACGNPLLPPAARASESFTGAAWPSFRPQNVVIVQPAPVQVTVIVLFDPDSGKFFGRPAGGNGHGDHQTPPPSSASTSESPLMAPPGSTSSSTAPGSSPSTPCDSQSQSGSSSSSSSGSSSGTSSGSQPPCPSTSSSSSPTSTSSSSSSSQTPSGSTPSSPSSSPTSTSGSGSTSTSGSGGSSSGKP